MTMRSLSLVLLSIFALSACQQEDIAKEAKSQQLKPVRTVTIALGQKATKSFPGVIDAAQTAELGFRVNGELKEIKVQEGGMVKKGDVLAKLDQTDFKLSLESAKSEFERIRSDFSRAEKLIKKGAISRADFDSLKAQKKGAQIQLETAEQNLKYTVLKAPFDGVIARTYVENFEKISSTEKFAAIQDLSALEVSIDVPESVMIKVKRREEQFDVIAVFDDLGGREFPLTFKEASTRADQNTQTYRVTFAMDYPEDTNILPGMSTFVVATEREEVDSSSDVFVPAHAVLEDGAGRFVYLASSNGDGKTATVTRRAVVVGQLNENGIQVLQGLTIGDEVITAGMSKVNDGLQVRLMHEASK